MQILTNHARVLINITLATKTQKALAQELQLTERFVNTVVSDLCMAGLVNKRINGRIAMYTCSENVKVATKDLAQAVALLNVEIKKRKPRS